MGDAKTKKSRDHKLTPFSLDTQAPVPMDEDDYRAFKLLNPHEFNKTNPYNHPGYMPVQHELSHIPVEMLGTLPKDLEGMYLRNGTNYQFNPPSIRMHSFAGAGMIHQIQIHDGEATYSNFYVRTPRFEVERKAGREVFTEFTDIAGGGQAGIEKIKLLQKKVAKGLIPELTHYELTPGSTSIRYHAGRIYCLQETGYAFVLHPQRGPWKRVVFDGSGHLETWNGDWEGPFSAHPRFDPVNGDMYNMSVTDGGKTLLAGVISQGQRHSQASIDLQPQGQPISWLHDFFLTDNYLIFPDISMRNDMTGLSKDEGSIFNFDAKYPLRWGVMSRDLTKDPAIKYFVTDSPGSIWHVITGWEQKGPDNSDQVVLFSPVFESYPSSVPIHTPVEPAAKVKTWTLDLGKGTVVNEETIIDHHYERPSLNLDYVTKVSRYCYLLDEEVDGYMGKGVLKYDMIDKKEIAYFSYGDMYGGEALFVPKADATREDDGYLLDILMKEDSSELLVLDATTMTELARLRLPQRVPFGVHATWVTTDETATLKIPS